MSTPVSIALNAAGIISGFSPLSRSITFYDQEQYLASGKIASGLGALGQALWKSVPSASGQGKIFDGIPFYRSATLRCGVDQRSRLCDQPIEQGAMITDHKVRMPRTVTCQFVCPGLLTGYTIAQLEQYYQSSNKIVIETPTGVYTNMVLESMPSNMTPENVSRPIYELRFRELLIVRPQEPGIDVTGAVDPADSDTQKMTVWSDVLVQATAVGNMLEVLSRI